MGLAKAKQSATDARLDGHGPVPAAGWSAPARAAALARFQAQGLPGPRDEYWRFTNPASLNQPDAIRASVFEAGEAPMFHQVDAHRLVFVDGVFDAEASDAGAIANVEISMLDTSVPMDIHWASDLYGQLEADGQSPVARPFAALNTAYATQGALIRVTGQADKPVQFVYLHRDETSDAIVHHVVRVEEGAEITLLENGPAAARLNKVMEIDVAHGAQVNHIRTQGRDHERRAVTHLFARVAEKSTFKSFTLTVNGILTRNEVILDITGDEATAHVAGAALGDGQFHHDDTVFVTHDAVNCESRQVFKKVLRNGAVGAFQGKILVQPGAQKTDGYQISQSLLLDGDSQFLAKPELEIYADDVACSHGSTSGAIDDEALFYLRSRGMPLADAQDLLVLAFVAEAIDEIEDEQIRDIILERLRGWLERHR